MVSVVVQLSRAELRARQVPRRTSFTAPFWTFFFAAFFFDLGIGLFVFLFNLYLTDLHFNEALVGKITASLTLGNVAATLPATLLARRLGLRKLLLFSFVCAPLLCVFRVLILWQPAQLVLAFATGMALCCWPICFSPAIASLTSEENRTRGFSIMFATGIGMGTLAGLLGGYVPGLFSSGGVIVGMRVVLLFACGATMAGAVPLWKLEVRDKLPAAGEPLRFHPFLLRILPPFALWNVVTGSFPAFGAIYLQQVLHIPLARLGVVFAASQLAQFSTVLASPWLYRRSGLAKGVGIAQLGTAVFLFLIGSTRSVSVAVAFFLSYNALLFLCGPGIYNLLMNRIPERERSTASAMQNLSGAICQSATQALTGICIVKFGYHAILVANSMFALAAAVLFLTMRESRAGDDPRDHCRLDTSCEAASQEITTT